MTGRRTGTSATTSPTGTRARSTSCGARSSTTPAAGCRGSRTRARSARPRGLLLDRDVLDLGLGRRPVEPLEVPVDQRAQREQELADDVPELTIEVSLHRARPSRT